MRPDPNFEAMLTGGHPNSLGRTIEVVNLVLADQSRLEALYSCYFSSDEVVRLRVSSGLKRVCREHPEWLVPYVDRLIRDISKIDQASTKWTLAQLFGMLKTQMSPAQIQKATEIMKRNLRESDDWIVQNTTMQVLFDWSEGNQPLREWILRVLEKMLDSKHGSVAKRANKLLQQAKS